MRSCENMKSNKKRMNYVHDIKKKLKFMVEIKRK